MTSELVGTDWPRAGVPTELGRRGSRGSCSWEKAQDWTGAVIQGRKLNPEGRCRLQGPWHCPGRFERATSGRPRSLVTGKWPSHSLRQGLSCHPTGCRDPRMKMTTPCVSSGKAALCRGWGWPSACPRAPHGSRLCPQAACGTPTSRRCCWGPGSWGCFSRRGTSLPRTRSY